jgi:biopolymer transport protein ExbD
MKLASKNKISTEFSMASMTDIVFLLLIFFMLTTSVANESVLEVVLPKSEGKQADNQPVVMEVSPSGDFCIRWNHDSEGSELNKNFRLK